MGFISSSVAALPVLSSRKHQLTVGAGGTAAPFPTPSGTAKSTASLILVQIQFFINCIPGGGGGGANRSSPQQHLKVVRAEGGSGGGGSWCKSCRHW
ncbi:MAG: hypothetical protein CM15mV55_810 [uncultured marine virus]|nr:MAG: hypothetical protein CM15mV55_810 [uncultured marine virus]